MSAVTMFTTTWCGFCTRLKRQLNDAGIEFHEVNLDHDPSHDDRIIAASGGYRTVPTVEIRGKMLVNPAVSEVQAELQSVSA